MPFLAIDFVLYHFDYFMPLPSGLQISPEMLVDSLMRVPLYILVAFPLLILRFFSFIFFTSLTLICLGVDLFGFVLFGTMCFLDLHICLLSQVREIFSYHVFK